MDIGTITAIREHRDDIKNYVRKVKVSKFTDKYGLEQEYTAKGILTGIESVLNDVTALTKAPAKFIQISTHEERDRMAGWLGDLSANIADGDMSGMANAIDQIKPTLRNLGIRYSDERMETFDEFINSRQKDAVNLSQHVVNVKEIELEVDELKEKIKNAHEQITEKLESLNSQSEKLAESINSTEGQQSNLVDLLAEAEVRSQEIENLLTTSKSHVELITNFSKRVSSREKQLDRQENYTEEFKKQLEVFRGDHEKYLKEAQELIENSKVALEYTTAEGLSAAFTERHNKSNKFFPKFSWLLSAGAFVIAAVWIGYLLTTDESTNLARLVARFSLLPILIAGAWFCAGQYVKQKNIAEDYAYKAAIAKSIVGFSDKLSTQADKGDDYFSFMKFALSQMLNDPLRRHGRKEPTSFENFRDAMQFWKNKDVM